MVVMTAMTGVVILAHQGGWDEILMVLGPILLMAALLRLAKKRVAAKQPGTDEVPDGTAHGAGSSGASPRDGSRPLR